MPEDGYLLIGKIAGAHGIRGDLKLLSYAESLSVFSQGSRILLKKGDQPGRFHIIDRVKPFKRHGLMTLKGVENRDQAESLAGLDVYMDAFFLPEPEEDAYYWKDLIGMSVFTAEGRSIGRLTEIIPTGSNDVYVVRDGQTEILVPALQSVVVDIDIDRNRITVDLPEGL